MFFSHWEFDGNAHNRHESLAAQMNNPGRSIVMGSNEVLILLYAQSI
jgi:hypothetical protein